MRKTGREVFAVARHTVSAVKARQAPRARRGSAPKLLCESAREVFAERGYRATTRQIAERAGVSHELICRYFESKEKLFFVAVVNPLLDAIDALHHRWLSEPNLRNMGLEDLVESFTAGFYLFLCRNRSIARAMVHIFNDGSTEGGLELVRQRINDTIESMAPPIASYFAVEGVRTSSTALQLRIVMLLVGVTATFLANTYPTDHDVPPRAMLIDELSRFIYHGLRAD